MKKNIILLLLNMSLWISVVHVSAQSVAINDDGSEPDASSILDIKSSIKGLLIPRMSTALRNLIPAPATGLMVYDTDLSTFFYYNGGIWVELAGGGGSSLWSVNGNHIFNSNAGNVGIGTNDPDWKLTVRTATRNYGFTHQTEILPWLVMLEVLCLEQTKPAGWERSAIIL